MYVYANENLSHFIVVIMYIDSVANRNRVTNNYLTFTVWAFRVIFQSSCSFEILKHVGYQGQYQISIWKKVIGVLIRNKAPGAFSIPIQQPKRPIEHNRPMLTHLSEFCQTHPTQEIKEKRQNRTLPAVMFPNNWRRRWQWAWSLPSWC